MASWQIMFELAWFRSHPLSQHQPQVDPKQSWKDAFDTTMFAQSRTSADRIERCECQNRFVHLGYVVSTYRRFQKAFDSFEDERCCVLFIRLLVDAFDPGDWPYGIPPLTKLASGLRDPSSRVTYV